MPWVDLGHPSCRNTAMTKPKIVVKVDLCQILKLVFMIWFYLTH